jgi:transcriptional regulator of met regulon
VPRHNVTLEWLLERTTRDGDCRIWDKAVSDSGYGAVNLGGGRVRGVHRLACTFAHGEPSAGMKALHSCDTPLCINPDHLRWGTQRENLADAYERTITGRRYLSDAELLDARRRRSEGESVRGLAREIGINSGTLSRLLNGARRPVIPEGTP